MSGIKLLLNSARGTYIPRDFVQDFAIECKESDKEAAKNGKAWLGIEASDVIACEDPNNEWYWEAWLDILNDAYWIDESDNKWTLWQDGDLFAVCDALMTKEEYLNFYGEEKEEE